MLFSSFLGRFHIGSNPQNVLIIILNQISISIFLENLTKESKVHLSPVLYMEVIFNGR